MNLTTKQREFFMWCGVIVAVWYVARKNRYATGCTGMRDDEWESIAGA